MYNVTVTKEQVKRIYGNSNFINEDGTFKYQTNPVKAMRHKCLYDCCAGNTEEVKNCNCTTCFLHPFRFGINPFRKKREESEEVLNRKKEHCKTIGKQNKN